MKKIATMLMMKTFGIICIIIAIGIIIFNIYKFFEKIYIQHNGIPVLATITYKIVNEDNDSIYNRNSSNASFANTDYNIRYSVDNKEYSYSFVSTNSSYKTDDTLYIYCLPSNPEKVDVSLERGNGILQIIFGCPIFFVLGFACVRY